MNLTDKLIELQRLNESRRAMLHRLYALGIDFPDPDLSEAFENIKSETERRIGRTLDIIDTLETLLDSEEASA